jgi:hypothetical protein
VLPRSTLETVTTETPRSRAMSFNLTAISGPSYSFLGCEESLSG